jgi:lysyl-tRNA synthetase class 2
VTDPRGEATDDATAPAPDAPTLDALSAERRKKREALADLGIDPYPLRFDRTATAAELHQRHDGLDPDVRTGEVVRMAGRLTSIRGHGKLSFATLQDVTGAVQLLMQASTLTDEAKAVLANADLGDWIGAEGEAVTSRRGELSVDVTGLWLLSKALRPLPDKWHGLTATDTRYRQREVDLLANPDSRRVFDIRFKAIAALRKQLLAEEFIEVDTPILQPQAGGALARPFMTRSNALDIELSLRIAPELYLKRLVVGGYERVFEIARNFRNEGIDTRHSPEFTAMEAYRAFGDVNDGMDLTERLVVEAARSATDRLTFTVGDRAIDLTPPWAARLVGGGGGPASASRRPGRGGAQGVRRARGGFPARVGLGQAHLRAVRHHPAPHRGRSGLRGRVPGRGVPPGPPHPRRPHSGRPVRAGHRRQGVRQRLQRAQHPRGATGAVPR